MPTKNWLIIACLLISGFCYGQEPDRIIELERTISTYFFQSRDEKTAFEHRRYDSPAEAIICILEIDSMGKVGSIHLLADENNRDSAYIILSGMKPSLFKYFKEEKYRNKVVMIPFILRSQRDQPSYVEKLADLTTILRRQIRNLVIGRSIVTNWPQIIDEGR